MISDQRVLVIRDLGSGSLKAKEDSKSLERIARYSPVTEKYGIFLASMAAEFGVPYIIEFGTSVGISTMYMASSTLATVYTMEGCPAISEVARENFREGGFSNIKSLTGSFEELLPSILQIGGQPGLIFIDGNHRKEPVLGYFEKMCLISGSRTVIIFDDIHYSKEMTEAWNIIKRDERVSMTVDIWRMGMVFFREGITKGNYKIRY